MPLNGIFILAELPADVAEGIRAVNEKYDARLARYRPPHITLTGSSGAGPIPPSVSVDEMRQKLEPITSDTAPITLSFEKPQLFMQTEIVVLPLDQHGPLRVLHDRIVASGLPFTRARYTFSPHVTLSLYKTLDQTALNELLRIRMPDPFVIS